MPALLGVIAGLALLLSIIGMYAMISNQVAARTQEFGIQMALGASIGQMIRQSIKPGIISTVIGLAIGLVLAQIGTRSLQGLLYGITPADRITYIVVGLSVLIIAIAASLIPALRIVTLDPSKTLRQE
jgi:ABC-type antimicrobial peptide transport system permease subunit